MKKKYFLENEYRKKKDFYRKAYINTQKRKKRKKYFHRK